MIYAATGHRPDKLGGYAPEVRRRLLDLAVDFLRPRRPDMVIVGMAQGWDTAVAQACSGLDIPYTAAVPFAGQEKKWPRPAQEFYRELLSGAAEVVIVCEGGYAPWKMQKRNEWMVDRCTRLMALWDGSPGGTANCLAYAERIGRHVDNLWPQYAAAATTSPAPSLLPASPRIW